MLDKKIVIAGLGIISPIGNTVKSFWNNLVDGKSGIKKISKFNSSKFACQYAGEITDFNMIDYGFSRKYERKLDDFTKYALAATKMCIDDAKMELKNLNSRSVGVFVGNCLGGVGLGERELFHLYQDGVQAVSPYQAISWFYTAPQGQISISFGIKGFSKTFVADRNSSDVAFGKAYEAIKLNRARAIFVCGTEGGLSQYGYLGFDTSNMITKRNQVDAYRPYDLTRSGLILGEGSATLLLEEEEEAKRRGASIYAEVLAYEQTCDGIDHEKSDNSGAELKRAIINCIKKSGLEIKDIDYINLDGSGTWEDDLTEMRVLKAIFRDRLKDVLLSCPKASYGHTFGAAGLMDMIVNCLVIHKGMVPPTINHYNKDPSCDLDCNFNYSKPADIKTALQIARGRGGINSAILIKKYDN